MAELTVTSIALNTTGTDITPAATVYATASGGGDYFANPSTGRAYIIVDTSASATTVTIASQATCSQGGTHNIALAVGATEMCIIGPFATARFNDANDRVQLTYSTATDVRIAVLQG